MAIITCHFHKLQVCTYVASFCPVFYKSALKSEGESVYDLDIIAAPALPYFIKSESAATLGETFEIVSRTLRSLLCTSQPVGKDCCPQTWKFA